MRTPFFWKNINIISIVLYPLSILYGIGYRLRCLLNFKKYKSETPVICIGNLVAGGAGKTPTALFVSKFLRRNGKTYCFLSKGYKGKIEKPTRVDLNSHNAREVGDEPLLLAEYGDTYVAKNRVEGLKYINSLAGKYDCIIMDDGLQNPTFEKDYSIVVVNGKSGFGNNMLLPAGPLRERLRSVKNKVDMVAIIDEDRHNIADLCKKYGIRYTFLETKYNLKKFLYENKFIAFSGIANPDKFFDSLDECSVKTLDYVTFPDHHIFRNCEIEMLIDMAKGWKYKLITTKKDWVRLKKKYRDDIFYFDMYLKLSNKHKRYEQAY